MCEPNENCANILGTGAVKIPRTFGFLPTATADQNAAALQAAVTGGGLILIDTPGVYELNQTILLDSNTRLVCVPGVIFKKVAPYCNVLLNRGALTREYNENITIDGLEVRVNGQEADPTLVYGLRGQMGFFRVRNLTLKNFTCVDGGPHQYLVYIVSWERLHIANVRLAGDKDGIKLHNGHDAVIEDLDLTTYDDGLSLCGTDYPSVVVEIGDVYNVRCSRITDHQYKNIFGRTCLIYTGSWADYANGNEYRSGDFCLHNGKLYQCVNPHGFVGVGAAPPVHPSGVVTGPDTISWRYIQECDFYHTDVYNVSFDHCIFEKSGNLIAVWIEHSDYQRNYYPGTERLSGAWGFSVANCMTHSEAQQVLVCAMGNLRDLTVTGCVLDNLEAVLRVDSSAFNDTMDVSIAGCTFRNTRNPFVAFHDGRRVVDWGLPFTQPGTRGYIADADAGEDGGLARTQPPVTMNCHLAGNNYHNAIFKYTLSNGARLRLVNPDLPFDSLDGLTPAVGDLCRHVDGLFIYRPSGWVNLSGEGR